MHNGREGEPERSVFNNVCPCHQLLVWREGTVMSDHTIILNRVLVLCSYGNWCHCSSKSCHSV